MVFLCVLIASQLKAQDCLEYAEIDGVACGACVPTGWTAISGTPDVIVPDGSYPGGACNINDLSGSSPGGGNVVLLAAAPPMYQESMTTTIGGLNTAQEYSFGLWWEQITASGCGSWFEGTLTIELDGETYMLDDAESWELFEICFTPSGESIDITLTIDVGTVQSVILVDSPDCSDLTACCLLTLEADDFYEVCPDEEIIFFAEYFDNNGSVDILWESDPPDGVNFLDDPTSITPTFLLPLNYDFEGQEYEFTVTVQDNDCQRQKMLTVVVRPAVIPDFDIYLCELDEDPLFPTVSLNGYSGFWEGNFNFENLGGTTQEFTFVLDPGQDNCVESWTYPIDIDEAVVLNFSYPTDYCELDDNRYTLPSESDENIIGEWNENRFNPYDLGPGEYEFHFIIDIDQCAHPYSMTIIVHEADIPIFNLPASYCRQDDSIALPTTSVNGIEGYWEKPEIDLSEIDEDIELTFYPDNYLDYCIEEFIYTYSISDDISNSFSINDSICRSSMQMIFDSLSSQGYLGYWTPLAVAFDTILVDTFSASWTPIGGQAQCLNDTSITFHLIEGLVPDFDIPLDYCLNSGIYLLPDTSLNSISGSWNVPSINTETGSSGILNLIFTPDSDSCAANYTLDINILDNHQAAFNFPTSLCQSDPPLTLPTISLDGYSGSWDVPVIDPSDISDSIVVNFTPDDFSTLCLAPVSIVLSVSENIDPEFFLPESFCLNFGTFPFNSTSANGIPGSWTYPTFDPNGFTQEIFSNTFTPNDINCYNVVTFDIPVIGFDTISLTPLNPSSCIIQDGELEITGTPNFEYSLDNGNTWQIDNLFTDLAAGPHTLLIRSTIDSFCREQRSFQLTSPIAPEIIDLVVLDLNDCLQANGSITCLADGENLEYSIDGGVSWQASNVFNGLEGGNYMVQVRNSLAVDCIDESQAFVEEAPQVTILDISTNNITDCSIIDGSIAINAMGNNLLYSIDGGGNWQDDPQFTNLTAGMYQLLVMDQNAINCFADTVVTLSGPGAPMIIDIRTEDISDCGRTDGMISIVATGIDLEYSIDNGISWTQNPDFTGIASGVYNCLVREINSPNCVAEGIAEIIEPLIPGIDNAISLQPSDCISDDASIELFTTFPEVEFSIDGGFSWQELNRFENLAEGTYDIRIRNKLSPSCISSFPVVFENPPCPCGALEIEFEVAKVNCYNPNSGIIEILNISGFEFSNDYSFEWEDGSSDLIHANLSSDWYSYQVYYDKNCIWQDSIFVEAFDPLSFGLLGFDVNCENLGSIEVVDIQGGSGIFEFSIDGISFQEEALFYNLSAEDYLVFVQDLFDCSASEDIAIDADYNLSLDLPGVAPIVLGESTLLNPLINVSSIDSFSWSPSEYILNPGDLIAEVAPAVTTEFVLEIFFGQCSEFRSVTVEVEDNREIFLGDIFTPDGDGNNDYFFVQSPQDAGILVDAFRIYDRWGNLVYSAFGPEPNKEKQGWNGIRNGENLVTGVYVYIVQYTKKGESKVKTGTVTLIR